jgi:hypothetical protein
MKNLSFCDFLLAMLVKKRKNRKSINKSQSIPLFFPKNKYEFV